MQIIQTILSAFLSALFLLLVSSCDAPRAHPHGGPYYYGNFSDYSVPPRPTDELTAEKAKTRDAYYVAYFDDNGKIVSREKYLYGSLEFTEQYAYKPDGVLDRKLVIKAGGETTMQYFDRNGRML